MYVASMALPVLSVYDCMELSQTALKSSLACDNVLPFPITKNGKSPCSVYIPNEPSLPCSICALTVFILGANVMIFFLYDDKF